MGVHAAHIMMLPAANLGNGPMRDEPPGIPVATALLDEVATRVRAFAGEVQATRVLVLDVSGSIVCSAGSDATDLDLIGDTLGALLAGVFSSARQLAAMCDEPGFRTLFQQGDRRSILTLLVSPNCLLVTIFDRRAHVGLVRMLAARLAEGIAGPLARLAADEGARETLHSPAFRASFDDTLDRLFHDISDEGE
jgi:predicted regulator of Ras-like GTPase activity (Roadblock/LC7/MglB family)